MVKLKIPGKAFLKSEYRTSVTFKLKLLFLYFSHFFHGSVLAKSMKKCENIKSVTEVRDSDFKNAFPGIFNFTVGILDW